MLPCAAGAQATWRAPLVTRQRASTGISGCVLGAQIQRMLSYFSETTPFYGKIIHTKIVIREGVLQLLKIIREGLLQLLEIIRGGLL